MNWHLAAEMNRLCVEKFGDSQLLSTFFALIRSISPHYLLNSELIRGSLILMPNNLITFAALLVSILPFCAFSSDQKITIELSFTPNLDNGKEIYALCASCHLPEGWGNTDGTYPQLAGQHQNVLIKQLLDIRSGQRNNPLMYPFVQERTVGGYQSLVDVVAYISTLPMTPKHGTGPWKQNSSQFKEGKALYKKHCSSCHGKTAEGNNTLKIPKLQGQHYKYLIRQLDLARKGIRTVDPAMQAVANHLIQKESPLIINYIAHLTVPEADMAPSKAPIPNDK